LSVFRTSHKTKTVITSNSTIITTQSRTIFSLDPLPYQYRDGALPLFSGKALTVHYKQYLSTTVNKANTLITNTEYMDMPLVDTIRKSFLDAGQRALFNHCAEIWNHNFFFHCLKPRSMLSHLDKDNEHVAIVYDRIALEPLRKIAKKYPPPTPAEAFAEAEATGQKPRHVVTVKELEADFIPTPHQEAMNQPEMEDLIQEINSSFANFEEFKRKFERYARAVGANGWVWLVDHQANLEIIATTGADNPLTKRFMTPLLGLDMWEHAFLLDYQYDTQEYVKNFWRSVNWKYVEQNWEKAKRAREYEKDLYYF